AKYLPNQSPITIRRWREVDTHCNTVAYGLWRANMVAYFLHAGLKLLLLFGLQHFQCILDKPMRRRPGLGVFFSTSVCHVESGNAVSFCVVLAARQFTLFHVVYHPTQHGRAYRRSASDFSDLLVFLLQHVLENTKMNICNIQFAHGKIAQ